MKKFIGGTAAAVAATAVIVSVGGSAGAADANSVSSTAGMRTGISALDRSGSGATKGEYDLVRSVAGNQHTSFLNMAPIASELAPLADSRVLDTGHPGRVVVVPSTRDGGMCIRFDLPELKHGSVDCTGGFDTSGIHAGWITGGSTGESVFGVASDDVDSLSLEMPDGSSLQLPVKNNTFYWHSDSSPAPSAIVSHKLTSDTRVSLGVE